MTSYRRLVSSWTSPLVLLLLLSVHIHESHAYGTGAPPGPTVCTTMTPEHGVGSQPGESPYTIELDNADIMGGQTVRVTLKSRFRNTPFAGFLVMGQKYGTNTDRAGAPEGTMAIGSGTNSDRAHHAACGDRAQGAMTHSNKDPKEQIVLEWTAPNEDGDYMILGTFVQSYTTFWVRQPSIKIRVKRDAGLAAPEAPVAATPQYSAETVALLHKYYDGCGETKGCYGLPENCVQTESCDMLTTFRLEGSRYVFQVTGKLPKEGSTQGHVSSGLSFDNKMGADSIVACISTPKNGVQVQAYYSEGTSLRRLEDPTAGLEALTRHINANRIFCEFSRSPEDLNSNFKVGQDKLYILMESGALEGTADEPVFNSFTVRFTPGPISFVSSTLMARRAEEAYEGCGETRGCFGLPTYQCITDRNCDMLVSYDKDFNFRLLGIAESAEAYIALGLSFDNRMGNDSVTACVSKGGQIEVNAYYNKPGYVNSLMNDTGAGIASVVSATHEDGLIFCEFIRTPVLESLDEVGENFDLANDQYYLLMAQGTPSSEPEDWSLTYHGNRGPSPVSIVLSEPIIVGAPVDHIDNFYTGCGESKGCYGLPSSDCIATRSCQAFVAFDKDFNFQLLWNMTGISGDGYVAVGLSFDGLMGHDSVIACVIKDGNVELQSYYNIPGQSYLMNDPNAGIGNVTLQELVNGGLLCEFQRTPTLESPNGVDPDFDLENDGYHLMLANGRLSSDGTLSYHFSDKGASYEKVKLSETEIIGIPPDSLDFYAGCGETKGCFGFPDYQCIYDKNCDMFASFDKDFKFQLLGKAGAVNSYVALGLSFDSTMSQDSVIACLYKDGDVQVKSYYNVPDGKGNLIMPDPSAGIDSISATIYENGQIFCEFTRTPVLESPDELGATFDLATDQYYLLLAQGQVSAESEDLTLQYHSERQPAPVSVLLSQTIIIGAPLDPSEAFYAGCGDTKGCFGIPTYRCVYDHNCEVFASYDKDFNFQLMGLSDGSDSTYVAVGLSFDSGMGKDSVIACVQKSGEVEVKSYYNYHTDEGDYANSIMNDNIAGIASVTSVQYANGRIFCEFNRTPALESLDEIGATFDLANDRYYLLLAQGRVSTDEDDYWALQQHNHKGAAPANVLLSDYIIIGTPPDSLDFYGGCGETKGCFGFPTYECIEGRNCKMFVSFDKELNFQVSGDMPPPDGDGYIAVGLSNDTGMGQDSVIACIWRGGEVHVASHYNVPDGKNNLPMEDPTTGLESITTKLYENGKIYCAFKRTPVLESPDELEATLDLLQYRFYLLLAEGKVTGNDLQYHANKISVPSSVLLSDITIIGAPLDPAEGFYTGCGDTKGCFGIPTYRCVYDHNCEVFVSYDKDFNFQLMGISAESGSTYVAVALSFDSGMGKDSVIACVQKNDVVEVKSYYNYHTDEGDYANSIMNDNTAGISSVTSVAYTNGRIFCEFNRTAALDSIDEVGANFDLFADQYYLLLAQGLANTGADDWAIQQHNHKGAAPVSVLLSDYVIIGTPPDSQDFYSGCGETKGCFGLPSYQCIADRNCKLFVSFDKDLNFQVSGDMAPTAGDGYVAVGLSRDAEMGQDSVTACIWRGGEVHIEAYYNVPDDKNNLPMDAASTGLANITSLLYENGKIFCEFQRTPLLESPDELGTTFDLLQDKFHLLLAEGRVSGNSLQVHATKAATPISVFFSDTTIIGAPVTPLERMYDLCKIGTHGCFGFPPGCVSYEICDMLVTFNVTGEQEREYHFQLAGTLGEASQGYVAIGLSFDKTMGNDLVTGCVLYQDNIHVNSYYNTEDPRWNTIMANNMSGLLSTDVEYSNGTLYCEFTRSALLNSTEEDNFEAAFDLETDEYFILLAKSFNLTVDNATGEIIGLGRHSPNDMGVSPESVFLNETVVIGENTDFSLADFYEGCETVKGCFGLPVGCITSESIPCELFVSFDSNYKFQIAGRIPDSSNLEGHVSSGLSYDNTMGADSVIGCVWKDGVVRSKSYYNYKDGKQNSIMVNQTAGLVNLAIGSYMDGYVFCEFTRTQTLLDAMNETGHDFDLLNDKFYIMLARASELPVSGPNGEKLGFHQDGVKDKGVSAEAVAMTYIGILGAKSNILIELHGGFMIIAWLLCASTGMFTARYYKQTHTDFNPLNKAFWFVLHISCMFTTAVLTVCGIIFIFVELGGYSQGLDGPGSWHPILGLILLGLAMTQVLIAFFRPHPGTRHRPLFNWVHWTIGNTAHIVGIACIFLAQRLSKTGLEGDQKYLAVIVAFVIFHVVMHVVMSIHTVWADKQMDIQNKLRGVRPGPMKHSGKSEEAPGSSFRTFMLALYLSGAAAVSVALVVFVASAL